MQTLGISDSIPRTDSRFRALFWPTIRNNVDYDYVSQQGFWICLIVAVFTLGVGLFTQPTIYVYVDALFFFLAGVGVRQRSRIAAIAAFAAYFLGTLVLQRYTGNGFSIARIIFMALLLANVRGSWLAATWQEQPDADEPPIRLSQTFTDKISDQLPGAIWPVARFVFYPLAAVEFGAVLLWLFLPRP